MSGVTRREILGCALVLCLPCYWLASEVFYARSNSPR